MLALRLIVRLAVLHVTLFTLQVTHMARAATSRLGTPMSHPTGLLPRMQPPLRRVASVAATGVSRISGPLTIADIAAMIKEAAHDIDEFAKTLPAEDGGAAKIGDLVLKARALFNTAAVLGSEVAPPGSLASLQADVIAFKTQLAELKAEMDKKRGLMLLRGVAAAIEELVLMHQTRLSQEQLRKVRVFSIGDARYLRRLSARVAARCMTAATKPTEHAAVSLAIDKALGAGLRGDDLEDVAQAAADALAAGGTKAEATAAAEEKLQEILIMEPAVATDLNAVKALKSTTHDELHTAYKALIAPHSPAAVASGRKEAGDAGNKEAHPDHLELAEADLEHYAQLLFGKSAHYTNVITMVGAFRRAYAAVYTPPPSAVLMK